MPPAGITPGPEGHYLARARSLCSRGEALGGRLVAWSAALLAMSWDSDSIEEAVLMAASIREEALAVERAWACGIGEGELEPLAPDGLRMQLAWGEALLVAASLARVARAGEVLIDGEVRALRAGQLSLVGARAAEDAGQRVRGWRLDLEHPWKRPSALQEPISPDATNRLRVVAQEPAVEGAVDDIEVELDDDDELSSSEVLRIVEATVDASTPPPSTAMRSGSALAAGLRKLTSGGASPDALEVLSQLRRVRARAEGAPPAARCQAALALAMTLSIAGRPEEALLEVLDALARAREAQDPKAIGASLALLAKLYAGAGYPDAAAYFRELLPEA